MTYFAQAGAMHGWNGPEGYIPAAPITAIVCDACAIETVPFEVRGTTACIWSGKPPPFNTIWHQTAPWKWAPWFGGNATCRDCGKKDI